jgi:hypothetical protein
MSTAATAVLLSLCGTCTMSTSIVTRNAVEAPLYPGRLAGGTPGVFGRAHAGRLPSLLSLSGGASSRPDAPTASLPPTMSRRIGNRGPQDKTKKDEEVEGDTGSADASDWNGKSSQTNPKSLDPSQILPSHTKGGSIVSALLMALRTHLPPRQIARLALSGCQIGILYGLFRLTWQAVQEAWEEVSEELEGMGGGGGSGGGVGVQEEHDRVWLDHAGVEAAVQHQATLLRIPNGLEEGNTSDENNDTSKQKVRRRGKRYVASFNTASELARRLRAAGMPMALPPDLDPNVLANTPNSVQHVLKSLTRTEGRLLSSTLLSPADDDDFGKESAVSSDTDARREQINGMWNSIGGLGDVKDSLLDLVFPLLMNQSGENSYYGGLLSNPPGVLLYGPPGTYQVLYLLRRYVAIPLLSPSSTKPYSPF